MASYDDYVAYKRDTKQILQWIIQSSNTIITLGPAKFDQSDEPKGPNTTGQTTVAGLVNMAKLIAKYATEPTPPSVFAQLQSVIKARTLAWAAHQRSSSNPDPKLVSHNSTHKHFIDSLQQVFDILGGGDWVSSKKRKDHELSPEDQSNLPPKNKFDVLGISDSQGEGGEEESGASADEGQNVAPTRRQQARPGRGKKGKSGKKNKKQAQVKGKEPALAEIPIESYKIIESDEDITTDYLLAIYALMREIIEIRQHLQGVWKQVAYDGLNSAVAGTVSMVAIAMIQRVEFTILLDFPGHESYDTIIRTVTRGDPVKRQGSFGMRTASRGSEERLAQGDVDLEEHFLIHTYRALLDFVVDFQKTRSGKPTRAMLKEIGNWDPNFNLQEATDAERIAWRRSYIIKWLYDVVNLFSTMVVQEQTTKGKGHEFKDVDWSPASPGDGPRNIFGLNEFAAAMTALAMEEPGTDVRDKIRPHHVFQLQCIADSLTVSRGWSLGLLHGHALEAPAPGFHPRRDIELFLDRNEKNCGHGLIEGIRVLANCLERGALIDGDPGRNKSYFTMLGSVQSDISQWLGEPDYKAAPEWLAPWQLPDSPSNGLWDFSPFLCGVGLMEALELTYAVGMAFWVRFPEMILCLHMHNMLVKKGYLEQPIEIYATLERYFAADFYSKGEPPTSDFAQELTRRMREVRCTLNTTLKSNRSRPARYAKRCGDVHEVFEMTRNTICKTKSHLLSYRKALWNPNLIPDSELSSENILGMARISQTKRSKDPDTGEIRFDDTELVKSARAAGMTDEELASISSFAMNKRISANEYAWLGDNPQNGRPYLAPDFEDLFPTNSSTDGGPEHVKLTNMDLLAFVQYDVSNDICGRHPLSGANYYWITSEFFLFFIYVENKLRERRNPVWMRTYETDNAYTKHKHIGLTLLVMTEEDEECLQVMADAFRSRNIGIKDRVYWKDLVDEPKMPGDASKSKTHRPEIECVVM